MAKEDTKGTESTDDDDSEDDAPAIDPAAIIKAAVEDAMDGWWKKNRPAPNRTSQGAESPSLMNTLFGSGYRK